MMSLRAVARTAAPRALRAVSASPITLGRATVRATSNVLRTQLPYKAFSTTVFRAAATEIDSELSEKLSTEIGYEQDIASNEPVPATVKDFLENGPFELVDTPGKEDVVLKRTFGNEQITISFSIADLQNYEPGMFDEDPALGDEEGAQNEEDMGEDGGAPVRLNIVIEKPSKGALNIDAVAQDGSIVVDNMFYYHDAKLAHGDSAETQHAAQAVYPGPPFGTLDEDLQVLMERYLEDRGINQALALFVPDYLDMKEQKEYLRWLNNLKGFVDAE
ncbi:Mitochondrial acidic protein mam33 [Neurospora sp. IMI 360204]|nr:Mitochondrial acidic protein mam33 [Neurospora sp. IMI 360204]